MTKLAEKLLEQPYWIVTLVLGVALVVFPCVSIDKSNYAWTSHPPTTLLPVVIGVLLLLLSSAAFGLTLLRNVGPSTTRTTGAGVDMTRVNEKDGALWTTVGDCEIRIIFGRIEDQARNPSSVIALPCNEYFDDECATDSRSALGAYAGHVFEGQAEAFVSLAREACRKQFGIGIEQQKTPDKRVESFGTGKCILLAKPLGRSAPVALLSTTTHRAGEGASGRISDLFVGMRALATRLADAKLSEVTMPVLGSGHAGITPPLALVGLLLAVAEVARYGQGAQRLRRVTIVVFKRDTTSDPQVDPLVVRRALALIAS